MEISVKRAVTEGNEVKEREFTFGKGNIKPTRILRLLGQNKFTFKGVKGLINGK